MIKAYLTATGPLSSNVVFAGPAKRAIVQVNAALTGNLTVYDASTTAQTGTAGIITNPTVGTRYEYWGFNNGVVVIPSATCDATVSVDLSNRGV